MSDLSAVIGANLADIRKQRGLSLDKVAELSGVSKAMIGQIERGDSSPTVATLWKIARGLHVSFSQLMLERAQGAEVVRLGDRPPMIDEEGGMKVHLLFPFRQNRPFETFLVSLAGGCGHASEAHASGAEEYVLVIGGRLEIITGQAAYILDAGDAIRYQADQPHIYRNLGDSEARFQNIVFYPGACDPAP